MLLGFSLLAPRHALVEPFSGGVPDSMTLPVHHDVSGVLQQLLPPPATPMTWRQLGELAVERGLLQIAAPAEWALVQSTLKNLASRGRAQRVGTVRVAGSARPMTLFARA
jgi:hypothetical protein